MPDTPTPGDEAIADPTAAPAPSETPARATELSPNACAARLTELFPALFGADGPPKPIKLRIQVDIQERAPGVFTKRVLSLFLSRYTTTTAYIKALLQTPHRFDLDGQPAGEISELHRTAATEELARRREIVEARRAAERDARRAAERQAREAHQAEHQARVRAQQQARQENEAEGAARRDRFALLRAFESSTLTKANFCVLKGLTGADLDAALAQARQERDQRPPPAPPLHQPPAGPRPEVQRDDRPAPADRPTRRRGPPREGGAPKPGR
jgi:ProP effector